MTDRLESNAGLMLIGELLDQRFVFDAKGRILHTRDVGVSPRFVLGRAAEGCIWRFRADLDEAVVRRVARLAARETAFPFDGETPASEPERLVMIERLLGAQRAQRIARREALSQDGVEVAELWQVD